MLLGMSFLCSSYLPANRSDGETTAQPGMAKRALSQSDYGLTADERLAIKVGQSFFRRLWVSAPASTQAADGLGPLYNARSCSSCHPNAGRGQRPEAGEGNSSSLLLRLDIPAQNSTQRQLLSTGRINNVPDPTYGLQLQPFAVPGHRAESRIKIDYAGSSVTLADGNRVSLRRPVYSIGALGYGSLHPQLRMSPRIAPQLTGLGLLEAIDEREILNREDPDDLDGDGISGRANRVWDELNGRVAIGRFGHKAGMPSIDQQVQAAFNLDLGLSVPIYPLASGDCSERQKLCLSAANGNSPQYDNLEVHHQVADLVRLYVSHLAMPSRSNSTDEVTASGKQLFERIGCQGCHTANYRTGSRSESPANHERVIAPYTDLLLHDMGEGLADNRPEGLANGCEWRTAPLWGIGSISQAGDRRNYLHDGRARTLLEAILWHEGEAKPQRDAVIALDRKSREQLLAFIESL